MLRRVNDSLPGLILSIVLYGLIVEAVGIFFVSDKAAYTIGLWYGILLAAGAAWNMATAIYDAVTAGEGRAGRLTAVKSAIRYLVIAAALFLLGFFRFGSLYMGLIGIFGLKAGAYMYPFLAKISWKLWGDNSWFPRYPETDTDISQENLDKEEKE